MNGNENIKMHSQILQKLTKAPHIQKYKMQKNLQPTISRIEIYIPADIKKNIYIYPS